MSDFAPARGFFRALAIDFDGTVFEDGRLSDEVLEALRATRRRGLRVLLVTGRILEELRATCPIVEKEVDAVVAENGGVVSFAGSTRRTAPSVDRRLAEALRAADVAYRAGDVLLACSANDEHTVLGELRNLDLDYQLIRNRSELMVLPVGVSKASGLLSLLDELGISAHNTVGIGDGENDASLLDACELSVAVANAVASVKERADIVLAEPDGAGVARFLQSSIIRGDQPGHSRRRKIVLGLTDDGDEVSLPSSQINLLIAGGTGDGKSYLAGLIAEQLIALRYSLLVIDPEGDFVGLEREPGTVVLEVNEPLVPLAAATKALVQQGMSVVLDFSGTTAGRSSRIAEIRLEVEADREAVGAPQWLIIDEAQDAIEADLAFRGHFDPSSTGRCLVTWQPEQLWPEILASVDAVVVTSGSGPPETAVALAAALTNTRPANIAERLRGRGRAVLAARGKPPVFFAVGARRTAHFRHEHKYALLGVDDDRRFYIRERSGVVLAVAGNLDELDAALATSPTSAILDHCRSHDFSRWIMDVFRAAPLATAVARVESRAADPRGEPIGDARAWLQQTLRLGRPAARI